MPEASSVAVISGVGPSRNVTVPVGEPAAPDAATATVKVTGWPKRLGFVELATVTVGGVGSRKRATWSYVVAFGSGIPGWFAGRSFMHALWTELRFGAAALDVGTPLLFDAGVFLAVTGVVLTIVFTLAEVTLGED